jgi:aminoglycoside phosphotransferase (APT) family kinase protein
VRGPGVLPRCPHSGEPPNAGWPRFVPACGRTTHPARNGAARAQGARGYPAAVTTTVGADPGVVGPYLAQVFGDERWRSVQIDLIAAGMSNLTYVVTPVGGSAEDAVILRRPPTGAVLATAHDMVREHKVISALAGTPVPVPRTMHLCTDTAVLGAPFYVMERVLGVHVVTELPPGYADEPAQRREVADGLIDVLGDLHTVDPAAVGLADFGRPEGFLERQVRRWTKQWDATRDTDRPNLDALAARLAETVPVTQRSGITHGDYRLDNCLLDPDVRGRIRAVLDWEMSTLGDPLTDLGMLFVYWPQAGEEQNATLSPVTTLPGFPTRLELAERYAARTGTDLSALNWYVGFAYFKFAAIVAGIVARSAAGAMAGKDTTGYAEKIDPCVEKGRAALEDGAL